MAHDIDSTSKRSSETCSPDRARDVIDFWREVGPQGWFVRNAAVDQRFRDMFYDLHFAAARRQCEHWITQPESGLALILLLDQFPRNVFRDTAHMFATDPLARHYARRFLDQGFIDQIDAELRLFICVPFVHSEALSDHDYALTLYQHHAAGSMEWAEHHRSIIVRFGRFPHRNDSLGRITTPEEQQFLDDGGFLG